MKEIKASLETTLKESEDKQSLMDVINESQAFYDADDKVDIISKLEEEMIQAAKSLEFEKAAEIRDKIRVLRENK